MYMVDKTDESYSHVLKYTGVFGGVQGLNVLMGLVRNKFVALLLGPGGMGLVSLFNTTINLISQATHLGISFSGVRHISELYDKSDEEQTAHFVKVIRGWSLLTALIGILVCIVAGPFLSESTFSWGDHSLHFILLAPAVGMMAITGGETAILKGQRKLGALAFFSLHRPGAVRLLHQNRSVFVLHGHAAVVAERDVISVRFRRIDDLLLSRGILQTPYRVGPAVPGHTRRNIRNGRAGRAGRRRAGVFLPRQRRVVVNKRPGRCDAARRKEKRRRNQACNPVNHSFFHPGILLFSSQSEKSIVISG